MGNNLTGYCKNFLEEGPLVGSIDGDRVGWRWLHTGGREFRVEIFAGTLKSAGRIEGGFESYGAYNLYTPTFDIKYSTPPDMRSDRTFDAVKQPLTREALLASPG